MRIALVIISLIITATSAAIFKKQNVNHGEIFESKLLRYKRQLPFYDDETVFFDQNEESSIQTGRSVVKYEKRKIGDGAPNPPQKIRLRGDKDLNANEGRVEVYDSKTKKWGLVCDGYWNDINAKVTCKQLGFQNGAHVATRGDYYGRSTWGDNDYILQKVQCSDKDQDIFHCPHDTVSQCTGKSAGVSCIYNEGCPKGWISFDGVCYQINIQQFKYKDAEKFCQDQNSKLAFILKPRENNFLSDVLYLQYKSISKIWTGGYYAEIKLDDGKIENRWNWYSTIHNVDQWNTSNLWFQGFSDRTADRRPQGNPKTRSCVAMSKVFADSQKSNTMYDVNYFWWDNLSCKEKLPFICQMTKPQGRSDCYDDNGFNYRGRASRTIQGSVCEKWSHPSATVNQQTNPNSGLEDHNFCRNPDNDVQPWCWTNPAHGIYGYCAIGKCSDMPETVTTLKPSKVDPAGFGQGNCQPSQFHCPSMITYNRQCIPKNDVCDKINHCLGKEDEDPEFCRNYLCTSNEFFCAADMFCILNSYICDGKRNCADGADESNCTKLDESEVLKYFDKFDKKILVSNEKIDYYNIPLDKCMAKCKMTFNEFKCKSFNYLPPNTTRPYTECNLLKKLQSDEPNNLIDIPYLGAHYSLKTDCTDQYKCKSGMCIAMTKKCDGKNDCGDNSDEIECTEATHPPFEIRLTGSDNKWEGKVEVRYQGEWGFVCDDGFDMNAANVICMQLGFLGAVESIHSSVNRFGKTRAPNIMLDELKCTGTEKSIEECSHDPWRTHNCKADELAGVVCRVDRACTNSEFRCNKDKMCINLKKVCDKTNDCSDGSDEPEGKCSITVTLVNGPDSNSGIVEVSRANLKGTVCDDGYDNNDATVICRMLGIPGRAEAVKGILFGERTGAIVLDNLMCNGDETSLENCPSFQWGQHKCTHKEDIGVRCGLPDIVIQTTPIATTVKVEKSSKCGNRPIVQGRSRVVGGFEAIYGGFPWQVGVRQKVDDYDSHWCGGTILSEDWIISAAHCYGRPKNEYRVRTGDWDNSADNNDMYEQVFEIEELIIHPQWNSAIYDYDLALIKIERNDGVGINFNNHVQPVCLPKLGMVPDPNSKCYVSGWGDTLSEYPEKLLAAEVPLITHQRCTEFYKGRLTERMQCAGYEGGGIDTCQGDSGGPLICKVNGVHTIFGATSWGNGCALPKQPGVYAKIQIMIDWVKSNTGL